MKSQVNEMTYLPITLSAIPMYCLLFNISSIMNW